MQVLEKANPAKSFQAKCFLIITFSDYDVRSADILHSLGWETLDQRRAKQLATSIYKAVNNLYPNELNTIFLNLPRKSTLTILEVVRTVCSPLDPERRLVKGASATVGLF